MKNLNFKYSYIIFFIIGLFCIAKPCYYYLRYNIVQFLLNDSWNAYQNDGYKKHNWMGLEPIGKITIPSINIENIILDGSDDASLNFGVGRVLSSANLHDKHHNIIIAGHRDNHFNRLKNISIDDTIHVSHIEGSSVYKVSEILIVDPLQVDIMEKRKKNQITLITCYPFNFIGDAPKRYVIIGKLILRKT